MARYIDADKIDFSPLKDDFDRARAKVIIMGQPTADVVEMKHGEWVHSSRGFDVSSDYECSICHSPSGIKHFYSGNMYLFCPDCGAKMGGGKAENDI